MRSYLDFGFDIFDRVGWLHFEGNGLAGESFDKDLHRDNFASSENRNRTLPSFLSERGASTNCDVDGFVNY